MLKDLNVPAEHKDEIKELIKKKKKTYLLQRILN
jgi:hypothetical protein